MAGSRYEYVRLFEQHDKLLPGCWIVVRLDGRGFSRFSNTHNFTKPNDLRALHLANAAAKHVLLTFDNHIVFAYGQSDEFSFVLRRQSTLFGRREDKILSTIVSLFTAAYVAKWSSFMNIPMTIIPSFDGRVVLYPTTRHLRDYLSWRQADVHINNLYNTAFWTLVQRENKSTKEAEEILRHTLSKDKHEILHAHQINYNNEPEIFRKGSLLVKLMPKQLDATVETHDKHNDVSVLHQDIISDQFWSNYPDLLSPSDLEPPRVHQ